MHMVVDLKGLQMKLNSHRDIWTSTLDYWWTEGGKIISPYFLSEEDAIKWREENDPDYSCNGTDTEYLSEWDEWKPNRDLK